MTSNQMTELVARLRDPRERFIFQGGSQFANELANLIKNMAQRVPLSDEHRLAIVEDLIRPVAFNRPVAIQIGLKVSHAVEQAHGIRQEGKE